MSNSVIDWSAVREGVRLLTSGAHLEAPTAIEAKAAPVAEAKAEPVPAPPATKPVIAMASPEAIAGASSGTEQAQEGLAAFGAFQWD